MLEKPKEIWDQLAHETGREYEMFKRYLAHPRRSRAKLGIARAYGLSHATIYAIAKRNNWEARSEAYDRYMESVGDTANDEAQLRAIIVESYGRAIRRLCAMVDEMDVPRLLEYCKFARNLIAELAHNAEFEVAHQNFLSSVISTDFVRYLQDQSRDLESADHRE